MARRREPEPVVPAAMPAALREYRAQDWMTADEIAEQDQYARYRSAHDYRRARARWFEEQGEPRDAAWRLANADGGSGRDVLSPGWRWPSSLVAGDRSRGHRNAQGDADPGHQAPAGDPLGVVPVRLATVGEPEVIDKPGVSGIGDCGSEPWPRG